MKKEANLATVEVVYAITNHISAKKVVVAHIRGRNVIMRRNDVKLGDKVVLIREDSVVPKDQEWGDFLYEWYGDGRVKKHKFRSIESDCIALPFKAFKGTDIDFKKLEVGTDLTRKLGITLYRNPNEKKGVFTKQNTKAYGKYLNWIKGDW